MVVSRQIEWVEDDDGVRFANVLQLEVLMHDAAADEPDPEIAAALRRVAAMLGRLSTATSEDFAIWRY